MTTLLAFIVTIGILVAVHEYGHYKVAKLCGIKVLRFSVGMGKPLLRWRHKGNETEFVIAALPLGGYVRMADEREAPVAEADRSRAFNNQPVSKRTAVVLAGPLANLLLAVLFFAAINWWGTQQPVAVLGTPVAGSIAAQAGLQSGDKIESARIGNGPMQDVASFEDLRWLITRAVLNQQDLSLQASAEAGQSRPRTIDLPLAALNAKEIKDDTFQTIGITMPAMPPVIREVNAGGAAQAAGLLAGDVIDRVNGSAVADATTLINLIAASSNKPDAQARQQTWEIRREGRPLTLHVTPALTERDGKTVGFINAQIGQQAYETVLVRYGLWRGLQRGAARTWEMSALTLQMFGRMLIGEASVKNISGPISIAQYAGQSASLGMEQFLYFLGIVSLSLGVLNLLPLPVLDGGHLMYYLWEAVTGRPVSDAWMERLQRVGIMALLLLMSLAVFNDISRLLG